MIQVAIARRYAAALFEVGLAQGQLEPFCEGLETMARALKASPELNAVMTSPSFTATQRHAVLAKMIPAMALPPMVANLLKLLVDRSRLAHVEAIARDLRSRVDAHQGRLRAKVTTAVKVDEATVARIQSQLGAATRKTVSVESAVDPSLLGGVVAEVGFQTFDGSLKTQLETLRTELSR